MSKKYWKLPKEEAEAWVKALKSGEYQQYPENLVTRREDLTGEDLGEQGKEICGYCCLGIYARYVKQMPFEYLIGQSILGDVSSEDYSFPSTLLSDASINNGTLSSVLINLNDGYGILTRIDLESKYPEIKFKEVEETREQFDSEDTIHPVKLGKYSFEEIAEFIEKHVEFI